MSYEFLEDVAIADAAFRAEAPSLERVFEVAAQAVMESMADPSKIRPSETMEIDLESNRPDDLLYDFLSEIVFLKDAETLLFSECEATIEKNETYTLRAAMSGERIDRERHELRQDVKAVTLHMFELEQRDSGWVATVVLDI